MQFNSYIFVFMVIPLSFCGYFLANRWNHTAAKLWLVLVSAGFYLYGGIETAIWLGFSVLVNFLFSYCLSTQEKGRKPLFVIAIVLNIFALFYFKYFAFFLETISSFVALDSVTRNIFLPLGVSFFTFQQIAYLAAVYKKPAFHVGVLDYLLYILYFPKLIMGPIVDPEELLSQFNDPARRKVDFENLAGGARLFAYGLFKKAFFADVFASAAAYGLNNTMQANSIELIISMLSYTFQIYFDFSGYSDMAIGVSQMLNIELPMNFDSPYKAISIRDFWKRWHISLTRFLTKYVYIPLGGSHKGQIRSYVNIIIVFVVSGIWHGANWTFLLWGLLHGFLSVSERIFEKQLNRLSEGTRWLGTFITTNFLMLLFASDSIGHWVLMIRKMLSFQSAPLSDDLIRAFSTAETNVLHESVHTLLFGPYYPEPSGLWVLLFLIAAFIMCLVPENAYRHRNTFRPLGTVSTSLIFVWALMCLGAETSFVYFGF